MLRTGQDRVKTPASECHRRRRGRQRRLGSGHGFEGVGSIRTAASSRGSCSSTQGGEVPHPLRTPGAGSGRSIRPCPEVMKLAPSKLGASAVSRCSHHSRLGGFVRTDCQLQRPQAPRSWVRSAPSTMPSSLKSEAASSVSHAPRSVERSAPSTWPSLLTSPTQSSGGATMNP